MNQQPQMQPQSPQQPQPVMPQQPQPAMPQQPNQQGMPKPPKQGVATWLWITLVLVVIGCALVWIFYIK